MGGSYLLSGSAFTTALRKNLIEAKVQRSIQECGEERIEDYRAPPGET
jgi:hypothetical protein